MNFLAEADFLKGSTERLGEGCKILRSLGIPAVLSTFSFVHHPTTVSLIPVVSMSQMTEVCIIRNFSSEVWMELARSLE